MNDGKTGVMPCLAAHKQTIVARWAELTLRDGQDAHENLPEQDRFRNPAGFLVRRNLALLFDGLLQGAGTEDMVAWLDAIVRLWVVQGRYGTDAASFVSPLKAVVMQELQACKCAAPADLATLDTRIDELQSMESGLLRRCRRQIDDIRIKEAQRREWVGERIARKRKAKDLA